MLFWELSLTPKTERNICSASAAHTHTYTNKKKDQQKGNKDRRVRGAVVVVTLLFLLRVIYRTDFLERRR